jgi:hypothetical protein
VMLSLWRSISYVSHVLSLHVLVLHKPRCFTFAWRGLARVFRLSLWAHKTGLSSRAIYVECFSTYRMFDI